MANTHSASLKPLIIARAREYLRNNNQLLASVAMDYQAESAALGQTVNIGYAADLSAASVSAANVAPAPSAITTGAKTITFNKEYKTSFALTGKEVQDYDLSSVFERQIDSAIAGLVNQVNSDLWAEYYKIPYAVGNSGTGFFASNIDGFADIDKLLTENKCPMYERKMMASLKDYAALLKDSSVQNANTYGGTEVMRRGVIQDVLGFEVMRDQQAPTHVVGSLTGDPDVTAETDAGSTSIGITCDAGDVVALKKGDLIEFGDGYSYSVQADVSIGNSATGTITLDRGLEATVAEDAALALATTTCTFDANSLVQVAGDFTGFGIAARLPQTNVMGYGTQGDHFAVVDPVTGFPLLMSIYSQYKQVAFEVSSIYGIQVIDSSKLCRVLTYSS